MISLVKSRFFPGYSMEYLAETRNSLAERTVPLEFVLTECFSLALIDLSKPLNDEYEHQGQLLTSATRIGGSLTAVLFRSCALFNRLPDAHTLKHLNSYCYKTH